MNATEYLNKQAAFADAAGASNSARILREAAELLATPPQEDTPTLRDQLAMTAVPQLMAARNWTTFDQLAEQAYAFADSMLKAKARQQ